VRPTAPEGEPLAEAGTPRRSRSRFTPARREPRDRLVLTERDAALLEDIFTHQVMDRGQIQALHFGSVARCNLRLRKLFDHGFVRRDFHPMAPYGTQGVYRIGAKAAPLLSRRLDLDAASIRQLCQGNKRPEFIEHALAVVDFYLAVKAALDGRPRRTDLPPVALESWLPELSVRHEYAVQRPGEKARQQVFKPDGFLRLMSGGQPLAFFLEMDRGNASARTFLQKVAHYREYRNLGLFSQMYQQDAFATLVVTTGVRRLLHLLALVREEGGGGAFFHFTTQEQLQTEGALAPIWHRGAGASEALVSLLEMTERRSLA
jgi:hypothetical protein